MPDQATALRRLAREISPAPVHAPVHSAYTTLRAAAAAASPIQPLPQRAPASDRASVIAVTSGKGGVGKSNVSLNLAVQFAAAGRKVLLVDADLGLANADVLCNVSLPFNLSHVISGRKTLQDVIVRTPFGFDLLGGASGLARMADLDDSGRRVLLGALYEAEREADVMIIDTGAGVHANVVTLCRAADHVLVVATPEPTSITDAYAMVKSIAGNSVAGNSVAGNSVGSPGGANKSETTGVRKISLLANQVSSVAEGRAVHDRVARVARQFLGLSVLDAGHIVSDEEMTRAVRKRTPLVLHAPASPASKCLKQLAMRLEPGLSGSPGETAALRGPLEVRESSPSFFRRFAGMLKKEQKTDAKGGS